MTLISAWKDLLCCEKIVVETPEELKPWSPMEPAVGSFAIAEDNAKLFKLAKKKYRNTIMYWKEKWSVVENSRSLFAK